MVCVSRTELRPAETPAATGVFRQSLALFRGCILIGASEKHFHQPAVKKIRPSTHQTASIAHFQPPAWVRSSSDDISGSQNSNSFVSSSIMFSSAVLKERHFDVVAASGISVSPEVRSRRAGSRRG